MQRQPELISLFCGAGGLDEGFRQAGFKTTLAYDKEEHCVRTHRHNHSQRHNFQGQALKADLSKIEATETRNDWFEHSENCPIGLIGGPPCQSFSHSNVHKKDDDPRDDLIEHYVRILTEWRESLHFFVFENVTALQSKKHVEKYVEFKEGASSAGFEVSWNTLNAKNFGVPQNRKRIFVVGLNRKHYPDPQFNFPEGTGEEAPTVKDAIGDLKEEPAYYRRNIKREEIPYHVNHWCSRPVSDKFSDDSITPGETSKSRSFRALAWERPSYTVAYGNREVHVHPECHRRLSIFEAMRLQGFPDEYELLGNMTQQVTMVSDAVPPPVAQAIAKELVMQLSFDFTKAA